MEWLRTDNQARGIKLLVANSMVLGRAKHVHDSRTCSFLAELHLEDGMVDGLGGYLVGEHVQLPTRDFKVGRRVFVLETECQSEVIQVSRRSRHTLVAVGFPLDRPSAVVAIVLGNASKTLVVPLSRAAFLAAATSSDVCFSAVPGASFSLTQLRGLHAEALFTYSELGPSVDRKRDVQPRSRRQVPQNRVAPYDKHERQY